MKVGRLTKRNMVIIQVSRRERGKIEGEKEKREIKY